MADSTDTTSGVAETAWEMAKFLRSHLPEQKGEERITAMLDLVADCQAALAGRRRETRR